MRLKCTYKGIPLESSPVSVLVISKEPSGVDIKAFTLPDLLERKKEIPVGT